jgi:hypothetical protein
LRWCVDGCSVLEVSSLVVVVVAMVAVGKVEISLGDGSTVCWGVVAVAVEV